MSARYAGRISFRPDARRLDDWPPLLNLGLAKGAKRFRRLLLARRNDLSQLASRWRTVGSAKVSTTA